jgi:hypothetical protein
MTTLRELFWAAALGVIGCFAFFLALGAISPGEMVGVTLVVGALCLLWALHGWRGHHAVGATRDDRLTHARERRGF